MPNWCNNTVQIGHSDSAKLVALVKAVNEGKFCNFAKPVPQDLMITAGRVGADDNPAQIALVEAENRNLATHGYKTWYDFCTNEWGTKWDVDPYDPVVIPDQAPLLSVTFGFDSAWAPPIGVYEALVDQGYSVKAYYYEPGMAFAGIWEDGDDDFYEIGGMTSDQVAEDLPSELDEMFGISECIAEYEAENEENE
jgi:hypothetical protein